MEGDQRMSVQTQNGKQAAPVTVNLEAKLFTIRYKADTAPHLAIRDQAVCAACERPCETFCPARVYEWQAGEGRMHVAFENCLECGTCRIACPHQNIDWRYPTGGTGIAYRYG
ncbi:MAG: 4Fe-4S dicluster domain-containing protein [Firmicutes bacterium]|jgi:ferredoxin like protein|nr:4Fe-4S ferredoxin [Bacillota bacterium]MBO2519634.1 4Fe-4S ferredoxin [Bacillota bacterium]NMA71528.1 4Fe-4S dicluster domain-containing protein [Bacillota bacterium]